MVKVKLLLMLIFLAATVSSCATFEQYTQSKKAKAAISSGNLKGMDKVEVIKTFGQPQATSQSGVAECWYYTKPKEMWVWFKEGKVDRWEAE